MNHRFGGYKAAFYVHALISIPTLLIMLQFRPGKAPALPVAKKGEKAITKPHFREGLGILIRNPDACIFFLMGQSSSRLCEGSHTGQARYRDRVIQLHLMV